jgi:endogenous inhibitor of DNA gyrase (YacG/DUF329 family)
VTMATMTEPCRQCGEPVEDGRECYAIPLCYACLRLRLVWTDPVDSAEPADETDVVTFRYPWSEPSTK